MIWKRGVRFYLGVSHALFVLVILSLAVLFWYNQQERLAKASLQVELEHRAQLLATASDTADLSSANVFQPIMTAALNDATQIVFLFPDGRLGNLSDKNLSPEDENTIRHVGQEALSGKTYSEEYQSSFAGDVIYAAAPVLTKQSDIAGAVCLILPIDEFIEHVNQSRMSLLAFVAGIALLNLLLAEVLATLITRPLRQVERLVSGVRGGNYSFRLPGKGINEMADLASHLNEMAEELEKQQNARRVVLANVTHELARPIGALRLGVDSLRAGAVNDPALAEDLLFEMNATLQRMVSLVEDLSLAARPIRQPIHVELKAVPVEPVVQGIRSRFWPRAETNDIDLEVIVPEAVPDVLADENRLNQVLANLLDNALKFSPMGGKVVLQVTTSETRLAFSVIDSGPGIPDTEIAQVFEPFYQSGAGSSIRQGMGLGLGIVQQLVVAMGGEIEILNRVEGGLQVTVQLPRA